MFEFEISFYFDFIQIGFVHIMLTIERYPLEIYARRIDVRNDNDDDTLNMRRWINETEHIRKMTSACIYCESVLNPSISFIELLYLICLIEHLTFSSFGITSKIINVWVYEAFQENKSFRMLIQKAQKTATTKEWQEINNKKTKKKKSFQIDNNRNNISIGYVKP